MGHRAEIEAGVSPQVIHRKLADRLDLSDCEVAVVLLPTLSARTRQGPLDPASFVASELGRIAAMIESMTVPEALKLVLVGEPQAIVAAHAFLPVGLKFHHWIAVKQEEVAAGYLLPSAHIGLAIYSTEPRLQHAKVRLAPTICPVCGNTTKDYGGKKHIRGTDYGTLMSDVWKDVVSPAGRLDPETESRVLDFLKTPGVTRMVVVDATDLATLPGAIGVAPVRAKLPPIQTAPSDSTASVIPTKSGILTGDCLEVMRKMPGDSVDLVFLDPPYNLDKAYASYSDDLAVEDYFTWCDTWLEQSVRVLKPGGSLVIINIPLWSIRHALYLNQRLTFQNWIAWDALSQPRGYIMPAHYPLLWYTKGEPRDFVRPATTGEETSTVLARPDGLCLRSGCVHKREGRYHGRQLTDLWTDIFRVLHNSQRLDHPCILPVKLMRRIVALFSPQKGVVFDPFNGVGTTTLSADLEGRGYLGIEMDTTYADVARTRHGIVAQGGDPFAKNPSRQKRESYEVPKKELQLEVVRVSKIVGHIPTRAELATHSKHPIEIFDKTFKSWYEMTVAAKKAGFTKAA